MFVEVLTFEVAIVAGIGSHIATSLFSFISNAYEESAFCYCPVLIFKGFGFLVQSA
jgi:hypothetical protein